MRNKVVVAFRKLNGVVAKPYDKLQQLAQEEGIRLVPRVLLFVCVELVEHLAEFARIEEEGGFAVKLSRMYAGIILSGNLNTYLS